METSTDIKRLKVKLGERTYPILIGSGLSAMLIELKDKLHQEDRKIAALVDEGLAISSPAFLDEILFDVPTLKIPSGEGSKSIEWLNKSWNFLASERIDRTGVLFVFGGGVTGDLGGFLAASYLRGIEFIQVPSTLLAMVDSSVGGKTGINLEAGKNLVGAFHQPNQVIIDLNILNTLPKREFSAGMAEIIKYGMLCNRSIYFELVESSKVLSPGNSELSGIIYQCCTEKARIVGDDELESSIQGGRALLNLGHTFGHAIEAVAGYGKYLHGEAVAIGLVCAFRLSLKLKLCDDESEDQLIGLLKKYHLPFELETPLSVESLRNAMMNDKKVQKGNLRFIVMQKIGKALVRDSVDLELVTDVLESVGAH